MAEHALELQVAWQRHVADGTERLERLVARYREKHRRYHTVAHVAWVVRHVTVLADEVDCELDVATAAAFYHDAVYEPRSPANANERASARLARRDLAALGWDEKPIDAVARMIEATAEHLDPADATTAVLFDADLSVLGADPARYADYVRNVRAEYAHVDDDAWRTGRATVLRRFLDRSSIFATVPGRDRWEQRARGNLETELAQLT